MKCGEFIEYGEITYRICSDSCCGVQYYFAELPDRSSCCAGGSHSRPGLAEECVKERIAKGIIIEAPKYATE